MQGLPAHAIATFAVGNHRDGDAENCRCMPSPGLRSKRLNTGR